MITSVEEENFQPALLKDLSNATSFIAEKLGNYKFIFFVIDFQ